MRREVPIAMYKIKNTYIDRMINRQVSSAEIDFLLYIAQFQDEYGTVQSVYYKDVCEAVGISIQKFYDILSSLTDKGLIDYKKIHRADLIVTLVGNDMTDKAEFNRGYLKVVSKKFDCDKFRALKAGSKLLYLYMQRFSKGKHMLVHNFYTEFCQLFQVTRKSMQIYLHELKMNCYLFVSKKRNRAYNYEMTMKNSTVLDSDEFNVPNENSRYVDNIMDLIRHNYKKVLPERDKEREKTLYDIAALTVQKRASKTKDFLTVLFQAIEKSFLVQKQENKEILILNAGLVNKCLTNFLDDCAERKNYIW